MLAFRYRKNAPSVVTRSPRQSAAMMSSASSTRRPRPSVGRPVAFQSGPRVLPIPNAGRRRPSLKKSMVAHCLARRSGSRSPTEATFIPNLIRRVAPASIAIALMHSRMGRRETSRSVCQSESTPPSSQRSTHLRNAAPDENGSSMRPRPTPIVIVHSSKSTSARAMDTRRGRGNGRRRASPGRRVRGVREGPEAPAPRAMRRRPACPRTRGMARPPRPRTGGGKALQGTRIRPWPRAALPPARAMPRGSRVRGSRGCPNGTNVSRFA